MNTASCNINRLVLVGNGFDLAHGLKTCYNDFIVWYLTQAVEQVKTQQPYSDELITIEKADDFYALSDLRPHGIYSPSTYVHYFYEHGFSTMLEAKYFKFHRSLNTYTNPFNFTIHSTLLKFLLLNCTSTNWVDIENAFYKLLKEIQYTSPDKDKKLKELNQSLQTIIGLLERYLDSLDVTAAKAGYTAILGSAFNPAEFVGLSAEAQENGTIGQTMLLNFNYTATIENYISAEDNTYQLNYIHGKLGDPDHPLIFGFGDELDKDYAQFEQEATNELFAYIKSFWYFRTGNYHKLIRFIDTCPYQVYIFGHSCGLSDRTMLNMIFEHNNCASIKIFYHQTESGNNYTTLTQEIARHFRNKQDMRRKIVPFSLSQAMPQATPTVGEQT